jgi:hypothetical protein
MTAPDPMAVVNRARSLVARYDDDTRELLAMDPVDIVGSMPGITIQFVPRGGGRCELDASYDSDTGMITLDSAASGSRLRFSCLHEFCHREIGFDDDISDWLWGLGTHCADETETLCDAFAAEILLPTSTIGDHLPRNFGARHVARLFTDSPASREACVVRAAEHLGGSGIVVLADEHGMVRFSSSRSLGMRLGRGVQQADNGVLARAGTAEYAAIVGRENFTLRTGKQTYNDFVGDAVRTDDGYVFGVFRDAGADVDMRGVAFESKKTWICNGCQEDIYDEDWCSTCQRKICQTCGCLCGSYGAKKKPRVCPNCHLEIPLALAECDCA